MLDIAGAELLGVFVFEIHRAHRANNARPARVREEDVDQRCEDVQVLREGEIVREVENEQCVPPPADGEDCVCGARFHPLEQPAESARDESARLRTTEHMLHCPIEQQREHECGDHPENEQCIAAVDRVAAKAGRLYDETAIDQPGDGGEHHKCEKLLTRGVDRVHP
jgi:hypothetical protein